MTADGVGDPPAPAPSPAPATEGSPAGEPGPEGRAPERNRPAPAGETGPGGRPPEPDRPAPRIRVIWNPGAGAKGGLPLHQVDEPTIRQLMAKAALGRELVRAETPAEARTEAGDAVSRGYDLVVAAGGDGTVGAVATALLGSRTALGILPLGSVMNIARSIGIPRDPAAAAEVIRTGSAIRIDVGEARGRPFFEAGSVGMNAAMFREAQRFELGDWSSIVRTVWVAIRYRPARMSIDLEDRRVRTRALMVTVSNGPYSGAGMTVAPDARLDDGRFDVRVFRRFSKVRLLRHLVSIAFGRFRYAPEVDTYRSRFVRVESARPLPARADSRDLGSTPVEFATRPAALLVVVPAAGSAADRTNHAAVGARPAAPPDAPPPARATDAPPPARSTDAPMEPLEEGGAPYKPITSRDDSAGEDRDRPA